ncbi:hypothetical protein BU16DRAFT_618124 [Lophium mytilinum]|uniref:Rhodopsin domain-containing protein n=1 Tax=Lophium mytilinum TaxID=390894 RepID=A0A6A6QT47_9PEZI|nr:hypothetical protein BU16DRAFT_618124 [Lophium mytilinum]
MENYPLDEHHGPYTLITHIVLTSIAMLVVGLRCVARFTSSGLKADDYVMVMALIVAITNLILTCIGVSHGTGRHVYFLKPDDIVTTVLTMFLGEFLLLLSLCLVKVSVMLFLLNFGGLKKWLRWTLLGNMSVICVSTFVFIVILWNQCKPVQANWNGKGTCISVQALMSVTYVLTAFTILTDFISVLLPFPIIWKLKLDMRTKISIMGVIGLGLFAAACSIVRICLVKDLRHSREDPTWDLVNLGVWTVVELHVAIIVASLPPCRALALRLYSKLRGRPYQATVYPGSSGASRTKQSKYSTKNGSVDVNVYDRTQDGWLRMDGIEARGDAGSDRSTSVLPLNANAAASSAA